MTERPDNVVRLIAGGLEGKLLTDAGAPLPVRVFERGGGELVLVLMLADDTERVPRRGPPGVARGAALGFYSPSATSRRKRGAY